MPMVINNCPAQDSLGSVPCRSCIQFMHIRDFDALMLSSIDCNVPYLLGTL